LQELAEGEAPPKTSRKQLQNYHKGLQPFQEKPFDSLFLPLSLGLIARARRRSLSTDQK